MSVLPTGEVAYRMKRTLPDGTQTLVLPPLEFLRRVALQVAKPRSHLVRYHGLFASHARDRQNITPPAPESASVSATDPATAKDATAKPAPRPRPRRLRWAELLRRVYGVDVLTCNRCGHRRRIIAAITAPATIDRILSHLGLAARPPPLRPARRSPQLELELPDRHDDCASPPCLAD